jgi:hypothetical protein
MPALDRASAGWAGVRVCRGEDPLLDVVSRRARLPETFSPHADGGPRVAPGPWAARLRLERCQMRIERLVPRRSQTPVRLPDAHQRHHHISTAALRQELGARVPAAHPDLHAVAEAHPLRPSPRPIHTDRAARQLRRHLPGFVQRIHGWEAARPPVTRGSRDVTDVLGFGGTPLPPPPCRAAATGSGVGRRRKRSQNTNDVHSQRQVAFPPSQLLTFDEPSRKSNGVNEERQMAFRPSQPQTFDDLSWKPNGVNAQRQMAFRPLATHTAALRVPPAPPPTSSPPPPTRPRPPAPRRTCTASSPCRCQSDAHGACRGGNAFGYDGDTPGEWAAPL